tara:strand:+ start:2880 stop:3611 length:732 start_codon:yes stop_codon:yes gene_type:complete
MKTQFVRNVMKQYKITQKDLAKEWSRLDGKPKFQEVVSRALSRKKIDSIMFAQALANIVLRPVGTIVNESLLDNEDYTKGDFQKDLVIKPLDNNGEIDENGVLIQCPANDLNRNIEYFHWSNALINMRPTLNVGDNLILSVIHDLDYKNIDNDTVVLCFDQYNQIILGRTSDKRIEKLELFSDDIYSAIKKSVTIKFSDIKSLYKVCAYVSHDTENKSNYFMKEIEGIKKSIEAIKNNVETLD